MKKQLLHITGKDNITQCEIYMSADNSDTAIIDIDGEINFWNNSSSQFKNAIAQCKASHVKNLLVKVNSPGGSVMDANEIYNVLSGWEGTKSLELGALCCSAATILTLAFPKESIAGYSNMTFMMHNIKISIHEAEIKDLESAIVLSENLQKMYIKNFATRMGISDTMLAKKMDATYWLTAEECLTYNLIGRIIDQQSVLPTNALEVFNKYNVREFPSVLNNAFPKVEQNEEFKNVETKFKKSMKQLILLLTTSFSFLKEKLTEQSNEAEIIASLTQAFADKESKILELTNLLKTSTESVTTLETKVKAHSVLMVTQMLDTAEKIEKKINADQRRVYMEMSETLGQDGLKKIIDAIPTRVGVKNMIEGNQLPSNLGTQNPTDLEERVEPEFTKDENGGRVYRGDETKSQAATFARMMLKLESK